MTLTFWRVSPSCWVEWPILWVSLLLPQAVGNFPSILSRYYEVKLSLKINQIEIKHICRTTLAYPPLHEINLSLWLNCLHNFLAKILQLYLGPAVTKWHWLKKGINNKLNAQVLKGNSLNLTGACTRATISQSRREHFHHPWKFPLQSIQKSANPHLLTVFSLHYDFYST